MPPLALGGRHRNIATLLGMGKLEWMATRQWKKCEDMYCIIVSTEYRRVTDG